MNNTPLASSFNPVSRLRRRALQASLDQLPRIRPASRSTAHTTPLAYSEPSSEMPQRLRERSPTLCDFPGKAPVLTTTTAAVALSATAPTTTTQTQTSVTTTSTSTSNSANTSNSTRSSTSNILPTHTASAALGKTSGAMGRSRVLPRPDRGLVHLPLPTPQAPDRRDKLNDALCRAIEDNDVQAVLECLREGASIFASVKFDLGSDSEASSSDADLAPNMLDYAVRTQRTHCARAMLQHCGPRDALQRDARLLDMLQHALANFGPAELLFSLIADLGLKLRSRSFDRMFRFLLRSDEMRLARLALAIGVDQDLTDKQLGYLAADAFELGTRDVVECLLLHFPDVLTLNVSTLPRLQYANGQALAVLLEAGLGLSAPSGEQLSSMLYRLLAAGEQTAARELLRVHIAVPVALKMLLLQAVHTGASRFLALVLQHLNPRDPALQDLLHEVQTEAVKSGYTAGVLLLNADQVDLFDRPKTALALLKRLVEEERTMALAAWIASGQVSLETVFLRLIRHSKMICLGELQAHFKLSFNEDIQATLRQSGMACVARLAQIIDDLRLAAQDGRLGQLKMKSVLALKGLCWTSCELLIAMRSGLFKAGLASHTSFPQQFTLAMAAHLANLDKPGWLTGRALLGNSEGLQWQIEMRALAELGIRVVRQARNLIEDELRATDIATQDAQELGRRLQMNVGLPPGMASLVQMACQQMSQVFGTQTLDKGVRALALAILRAMRESVAPVLAPQDPISLWHCVAWQMLHEVCVRMEKEAMQSGQATGTSLREKIS